MTRDEWFKLSEAVAATWPAGKMNHDTAELWYELLDDLEGGHVALALSALGKTREFMPSASEIRAEVARQEATLAPKQIPEWRADDAGRITFAEWRRRGYPGLEQHGITAERVEEMIREGLLPGVPTDA